VNEQEITLDSEQLEAIQVVWSEAYPESCIASVWQIESEQYRDYQLRLSDGEPVNLLVTLLMHHDDKVVVACTFHAARLIEKFKVANGFKAVAR
jgi:hypothetical protein